MLPPAPAPPPMALDPPVLLPPAPGPPALCPPVLLPPALLPLVPGEAPPLEGSPALAEAVPGSELKMMVSAGPPHAPVTKNAESVNDAQKPDPPRSCPATIAEQSNIEKALWSSSMLEHQFDGLVGPTHHYAGLSPGNLASQSHAGEPSNPRAAALEGLAKMRHVRELGVPQAVLPPQPRPSSSLLRRLGFTGDDQAVLERSLRDAPDLLHAASSSSSMWAANAATVVPASDTLDGRTHLVPANLVSLLHRSIEAESTAQVLRRVFSSSEHFVVHEPLPACDALADEGAANHTRLFTERGTAHLFGWGRRAGEAAPTRKFPARQAYAASAAVARACSLAVECSLLWQQAPSGIDAGAFHSDVLAVGNGALLLLHEHAFENHATLLVRLRASLGDGFRAIVASDAELPLADAVAAYPFNSQLLTLPSGKMRLVAPLESQGNAAARRFLERVVDESEVEGVDYLDVNGSMRNGGGPACLRLRVPLSELEQGALAGTVLFDERLERELTRIVSQRYRDRLVLGDIADPSLLVEARTALDEITQALGLGAVFDFQR